VVTPFLLHRGVRPRYAIGCVNTAEVAVASASAYSLIAALGRAGNTGPTVVAMLLGGVVAAPFAAWVIRHIPAGPMGVSVAGLLLLTNARDLMAWAGLRSDLGQWAIYAAILAVTAVGFLMALGYFGSKTAAAEAAPATPIDEPSSETLSQ
jgi:hypothetical protein